MKRKIKIIKRRKISKRNIRNRKFIKRRREKFQRGIQKKDYQIEKEIVNKILKKVFNVKLN